MSSDETEKSPIERFLDSYLEELLAMSDKDVLEGLDPAALKLEACQMLNAAKAEAGRRRLEAAKKRLANAPTNTFARNVSAAEARAYLVRAANDPRFTLAARALSEMSDDEAIMLYEQMLLLQGSDNQASEE